MLNIAESFKRFREHFNLSKTDVARTLGIKLPSYSYETKGKNIYPNGVTLIKLAKAYNVSTDYLLGLTDNPRPYITKDEPEELSNESNKTLTFEERIANLENTVAKLAK